MINNGMPEIVNEIKTLSPEQEAVKNVVLAKMQTLEQIKLKRRDLKDKLKMIMLEDGEYKETFQLTDLQKKKLKLAKDRLAMKPEIFDITEEIKELNRNYNETKKDISEYLITFESLTGQLSFVDPTGNEVKIEKSSKPKIVKVDFKEKQRRGRR